LYAYLPPSSDWFPGTKLRLVPHRTEVRCMSEKKPKITSLFYSSPRVSGQTGQKAISLRCQNIRPGNAIAFTQAKLCSHLHVVDHCAGAGNHRAQPRSSHSSLALMAFSSQIAPLERFAPKVR